MQSYKLTAQHKDGTVVNLQVSTLEGDTSAIDMAKALKASGDFSNVSLVVNKEKKVAF